MGFPLVEDGEGERRWTREGPEGEKPDRIPGGKSREKRLKRATEDLRLQGPFS